LGAAIIAITGITTGCPPQITCYDPVPQNWFSFDSIDQNDYSVVADLPEDSVLTGKVYQPTFNHYAFRIETADYQIVDTGSIQTADGEFTESTEDFRMTIDQTLDTGSYRLNIYSLKRSDEENSYLVYQIGLKIK